MKLSAATALVLISATVLLSHTDGVQSASALVETQLNKDHVPSQGNPSLDDRGWRAPVIDKKLQLSPVEKQKPTSITKKRTQRSSHAKELVKRSRSEGDSKDAPATDKKTQHQRIRVSYESNSSGQQHSSASRPQHKTRNPEKVAVNDHHKDTADPTTPGLQQQQDDGKQDDGTGDLFEVESGGMVTHQYYNATNVQEQARMVSAAVKVQMAEAESLRQDASSNSLVGIIAVVGLVVGAVGIIVAVVALLRQYSEFAEVELESDLPDVEAGKAQVSNAEVEMVAIASAHGVADASEKSSYLPSDVEEEEETKEGDDGVC